jgi:hypothetical protein
MPDKSNELDLICSMLSALLRELARLCCLASYSLISISTGTLIILVIITLFYTCLKAPSRHSVFAGNSRVHFRKPGRA